MPDYNLPDMNNKLETHEERRAIREYLYDLVQKIKNMRIAAGDLDKELLDTINNAKSTAESAMKYFDALKVSKIKAERIDVERLYVKHLNGADGTFTGTATIVNPENTNEQIIFGQNTEGNFGVFVTRDGGETFITYFDFDGLNGEALVPGTVDLDNSPQFTYTGSFVSISDGSGNWRIKFLTSGTFTPAADMTVDAFLVGGGGGGGTGGGGGGGRTLTHDSINLTAGVGYPVVIGAGGAFNANGSATTFAGYSAAGGTKGGSTDGGNGGSGGGGTGADGGNGGTNGSDGQDSDYGYGGDGLDVATGTREFHEAGGDLYGGGGGGAAAGPESDDGGYGGAGGGGNGYGNNHAASSGQTNKGGGGGGGDNETGGTGIGIIRNHRA